MHIKNLCQPTFSIHTIRTLMVCQRLVMVSLTQEEPLNIPEYSSLLYIKTNYKGFKPLSFLVVLIAFHIRFRVYGLGRGLS